MKTGIQATVIRITGRQTMTGLKTIMMIGATMTCRRRKETVSVEPVRRFYKK